MHLKTLKELYVHMEWADAVVWAATLASDLTASDSALNDTLMHLHNTQRAFLEVWHQRPVNLPKRDDFRTAREVRDWARSFHPLSHTYLDGLSPEALTKTIEIPWTKYFEDRIGVPAGPVTLGESIYQVVAHSMYHRGQANRRLRELGTEPPLVDYIAWLWFGRPEPNWGT